MTEAGFAAALMLKAEKALASAQLLLSSGDAEGACNRAYYAMFDAARAALAASGAPTGPEAAKTHKGLIKVFNEHLIKNGPFPKDLGRTLKRAEELRIAADYDSDTIENGEAQRHRECGELPGLYTRAIFSR